MTKSICVYCGSSPGRQSLYLDNARLLADAFVAADIQLIYGGASIGIMGELANQVLAQGGKVIGVIPESLANQEVMHTGLTELHVTHSMHARKLKMAELADGFIALPGGIGTLEELFEIWTWSQLKFHQKPIGLLNIAGYFDGLLNFLDHMRDEQFFRSEHRQILHASSNIENLLTYFDQYWQANNVQESIKNQSDLL